MVLRNHQDSHWGGREEEGEGPDEILSSRGK